MAKKITKDWYKSKTVWAAVAAGVFGVLQALGVGVPNELYAIAAALGLYGLRKADTPIK